MFRPYLLKKNITAISVDTLVSWGIKAVFLDVDNTLTAHNSQGLSTAVSDWLNAVQEAGITPMLVSNGNEPRIKPFATKVGLPYTASAAKPLPFGFLRAAKRLGLPKKACLVIGDQIFTDVLGGKMAGIRVIQTLPLDLSSDTKFIRLKRKLERLCMKHWEVDE